MQHWSTHFAKQAYYRDLPLSRRRKPLNQAERGRTPMSSTQPMPKGALDALLRREDNYILMKGVSSLQWKVPAPHTRNASRCASSDFV